MKYIFLFLFLIEIASNLNAIEITVTKDGSGDYISLQAAIDAQRPFNPEPIIIQLKPGVYREKVTIATWQTGITILGESAESTIIVWNDYNGKGTINTFTSYTFMVQGNDFRAENITFMNDAGQVGQAVALHVEADRAVFINCRMIGDQDTFYAGREGSRIYAENCYIEGTTDFIFGPSTVYFHNCTIVSKKNSYITAASTPKDIQYGYVFVNCRLQAIEGVNKVYLGRPWRNYAKTVFINCQMDAHILAEGWHNWNRPEADKTVFYAEYGSYGAGANPNGRVTWSRQLKPKELKKHLPEKVLWQNYKQ